MNAEEAELVLQAVLYNNEELLGELLTANPHAKNVAGFVLGGVQTSPFHVAASKGYTACLRAFLNAQCDVDSASGSKTALKTPLLLASEHGHSEAVELLIEAGADLFYCDSNGHSALQLAQMGGHGKTAKVLMDSLERINLASSSLRVEFCRACTDGDCATVLRLLAEMPKQSRQSVTNGTSTDEKSALYLACEHGRADVLQALLTIPGHIIIFAPTGDNVLHAAVASQNVETVQIILAKFPFLMDASDNEGSLPLHWACRSGNFEVVKIMLETQYPLEECKFYEDCRGVQTYNFVCDLNAADSECRTPFYLATANGHTPIVYFMVNFKIELFREGSEPCVECPFALDIYCSNGRTALMTACANGSIDIVRILLDYKVDVNLPIALTESEIRELRPEEARCAGSGALVEAAKFGNVKLIKLLLKRGALDYDNRALTVAVSTGKSEQISIFLSQLAFGDSEYRINKNFPNEASLPGPGGVMLNSTNLLANIFPSSAVQLNWHGATLEKLATEWITSAALKFNPRLKRSSLAFAAITRLDLSLNRLAEVPLVVFQLQSLHVLDLSQNLIQKIEIHSGDAGLAFLETLNLEANFIGALPPVLFSKSFPSLKTLNVAGNRLRLVPPVVWMAPRLKELNLSNNEILEVCSMSVSNPRPRKSVKEAYQERVDSRATRLRGRARLPKNSPKREVPVATSTAQDVIRLNVWQKHVQLSNIDDLETEDSTDAAGDVFSNCLRSLNLSCNKLSSVPDSLACCCPKLTRLNLSMNSIVTLGAVECLPSSLRHLNLSHNRLSKMFLRADPDHLTCQAPVVGGADTRQQQRAGGNRHSRSRSRSVARNQRSLSVARVSDGGETTTPSEVCPHKSHCRFEALKTLNLSHNELTQLELFMGFNLKNDFGSFNLKENGSEMRSYLVFPALTNLDVSFNSLRVVPSTISLLSYLAALNVSGNRELDSLPNELGLLDKLWNITLKECPMKEPIKSIVSGDNYKTVELTALLRNRLENSKQYNKLKLMIFGGPGVGKTQLLQQLRAEGSVTKKNLQSESWARRLGHSPVRSSAKALSSKSVNVTSSCVDVSEWTFEPKKSSKNTVDSVGPITFRTWDFDSKSKEYANVCQYFLSRRAVYLVLWKATDGEIALNEIHEWLLLIQMRAPNSTVIIVGTHFDAVEENIDRFPLDYLDTLYKSIHERFVNCPDSDKKGLPRVAASVFVGTKYNIKSLCTLIYQAASELKTTGRKSKVLSQKVPAIYLVLEKVVVGLTDELRARCVEPIMKFDEFWNTCSARVLEEYGRPFRDKAEFSQACSFLNDNGILVYFDDSALSEYCFLDPPWLATALMTAILPKPGTGNHDNSVINVNDILQLTKQFIAKVAPESSKNCLLKGCILKILSRYEAVLPCQNRLLLVPSSLPDEYLLRADYPGARIRQKTKNSVFHLAWKPPSMVASMSPTRKSLFHRKIVRTLAGKHFGGSRDSPESPRKVTFESAPSPRPLEKKLITVHQHPRRNLRRVLMMQYTPPWFWPRLITRILDDEKITRTVGKLFVVQSSEGTPLNSARRPSGGAGAESTGVQQLKEVLDKEGFEFLLWKTGLEVNAFGTFLLSLKQFLPLASVRDVNYYTSDLRRRGEDGVWRSVSIQNSLIELLVPNFSVKVALSDGSEYLLEQDRVIATRLLAVLVNIIDDLLEDWFPSLGTRFVHTSEGRLLVDRLIPCPECASSEHNHLKSQKSVDMDAHSLSSMSTPPRSQTLDNFVLVAKSAVHLFSVEECILAARGLPVAANTPSFDLTCPKHEQVAVEDMAPDVVFVDLSGDLAIGEDSIKRGKLMGRGAFGFVFSGYVRKREHEAFAEVALKILEPVEPGQNAKNSAQAAFEAFILKWKNDALENCARSYCTARQELNMLADLNHQNVTSLLGFCPKPLTIAVELAPFGALDQILSKYRRCDSRLSVECLQQVAMQIAKALEYLHQNRIIYRDLKSENVLVWRFPLPRSMSDVQVKLGDYGISRYSYPSGVCKGYGGTEGFMAPEIIRSNGEQEYDEKVDCFSFGMFIYELISLKQPYDGQEQMKDFILDGGRPFLSDKELLISSNVLDLMVSCWAEKSEHRPTASQLVAVTSAPEFGQLLDVILVDDRIGTGMASLVAMPPECSGSVSHNANCWLKSSANDAVFAFSCSPFGWLESKQIPVPNTSKAIITCVVAVDENLVWTGDSLGTVRTFSNLTLEQVDAFQLADLDPVYAKQHCSIQNMAVFSEKQIALVSLLHSVLLLSVNGRDRPDFVSSIELAEAIHVLSFAPAIGNWQIWTGHENGKMIVHHMNGKKNQLIYSASVNHTSPSKLRSTDVCVVPETRPVGCIVASQLNSNIVWSSIKGGSILYLWDNCVSRKTLDCRKILPVSESLSSMDVEAVRDSVITSLCTLQHPLDQVLIGTSNGMLVVVDGRELTPLSAFRPFLASIDQVLPVSCASFAMPINHREPSLQSLSSITSELNERKRTDTSSTSAESGVDYLTEAVSKVKSMFSSKMDKDAFQDEAADSSYFVVIGHSYRPLLGRFLTAAPAASGLNLPNDSRTCAIVFKTKHFEV